MGGCGSKNKNGSSSSTAASQVTPSSPSLSVRNYPKAPPPVGPTPIRLVMVGHSGGGKTSLLVQFVKKTFNNNTVATVGVNLESKRFPIDGKEAKLTIWDTAGQEIFHAMTHLYYRGAHGAMIVYDTTDRKSFLRMKEWYAELMENAPDTITVMIVANKIDLNNDATSPEEVDEFLHSVGHPLFERCSAQRGDNVTEAFTELCRQVLIVNPSLASV